MAHPYAFRNCQVAAPLKPLVAGVEARAVVPFRNCQVAAPLKLPALMGGRAIQGPLPQLSSCGPIEACLAPQCQKHCAPFRNCQVAAPLKRRGGPGGRGGRHAFRNCQVAAPLKREARGRIVRIHLLLPQLSSCGPIEAAGADLCARRADTPFRNCQVAAPLKRRPMPASWAGRGPSATVKLRPH